MNVIIFFVIAIIISLILGYFFGSVSVSVRKGRDLQFWQDKFHQVEKDSTTIIAQQEIREENFNSNLKQKEVQISDLKILLEESQKDSGLLKEQSMSAVANLNSAIKSIEEKNAEISSLKKELVELKEKYIQVNEKNALAEAQNRTLDEKLQTQKKELENLGKKINTEFENIANKIFEAKSEKFTELSKNNLKSILEPLGKDIHDFKNKVEEVYVKEAQGRFSLEEKVKELAELNQRISLEARNLTNALKGEVKTQGAWGEMILEKILEMSGLRKGEEYFLQEQLTDKNGKPLTSDSEGKKMRPDAIVKYPDNRNVIIDSKVSLNAYNRFASASTPEEQKKELDAHVSAIKNHIIMLSTKGYDDYNRSLDFVMMFIPSEPAYIAALQGDSNLWNFAYEKRILLLNPTNLITSLKLIVDLWKREYQNQNALDIAERGAKLYDKFVGFIENMDGIGESLNKAITKYEDAYKQLSTGNDNLVRQAEKLRSLGLKTKKELKISGEDEGKEPGN